MPALNHIHTYSRWKKRFYRCIDPDCYHYVDKTFLVGKRALCKFCGEEFILTKEDLRRADPRCMQCSNTSASRARNSILDVLEGIEIQDTAIVQQKDPNQEP